MTERAPRVMRKMLKSTALCQHQGRGDVTCTGRILLSLRLSVFAQGGIFRGKRRMNYLQAVFWDYPEFTNPDTIRRYLTEPGNERMYRWILKRFLEHGRVVDTLTFFRLETIAQELPRLRVTPYTNKKWNRILEVYGHASRR